MSNVDRGSGRELLSELAAGLAMIHSSGHEYVSSALYTDCLIRTMAEMGRKRNYDAHPDPMRAGFYKEYLFDSSWWSGSELVLAAESEWGKWTDVAYDFPKLLVAKASLKILITDSGSHKTDRAVFQQQLERMLQNYRRHTSGERYLWIDVHGTKKGGALYGNEAEITSDGECREARFLPTSPERFDYDFIERIGVFDLGR